MVNQLSGRDQIPHEITRELDIVAPVLAVHLRIKDRVHLASELCQGCPLYTPSAHVKEWFNSSLVLDVAMNLPYLSRPKTMLDSFSGCEVGEKVKCSFDGMKWEGRELTHK